MNSKTKNLYKMDLGFIKSSLNSLLNKEGKNETKV
jgi:hypothetical protein